ncbi:MAG: CRISPR-associated protein Csx16 [Lysobacterales bacterium]
MTTFLVTRHPGALHWLRAQGFTDAVHVPHLDLAQVTAGDTVVGTLPVHVVAAVCAHAALSASVHRPAGRSAWR